MRMWLAVRTDIVMSPGKLAGQAGHAYGNLFGDVWAERPELMLAYVEGREPGQPVDRGQKKVTLRVKSEAALRRVYEEARTAGIPAVLVIDEGHTELPPGTPTMVAFGPAHPENLSRYLANMQVWRAPPVEAPREVDAAGD